MAPVQKLHLEDCLDDTPQTKAMLDLFEKDTNMLKKFSKAFSSSCQKISSAQLMMISATQELSYYLRLYGEQNFPLDPPTETETTVEPSKPQKQSAASANVTDSSDDDFINISTKDSKNNLTSTLNQFANYIDEISTCFQVFVTQLNDAMIDPLNKLIDNEFQEINSQSQMYQICTEEEDQAMQKYLRLSTRKENDLQRNQIGEQIYSLKKKLHQSSMSYFSSLNYLQYKRQYMLVEPMLSFMHSLKLFFKMGSETFNTNASSTIDKFLNETSSRVCEVKTNLGEEMNKTNQIIDLLQQDESIYYIDSGSSELANESPISKLILQKNGYLNLKSKIPFISIWDRAYYFIQNGHLMCMHKNEVAGTSFMELKSDFSVSTCEIDERPFTFQIISQFPKKVTYFQANSNRDRNEWIQILSNAINDDNRAKLLNYKTAQTLSSGSKSSIENKASPTNPEPNIRFELKELLKKDQILRSSIAKPQQGDTYKVRFLGSMNVRSDRGNEYIQETIRNVMGARAKHNIFKLSEYNLIINSESISLFSVPASAEKLEAEAGQSKLDIKHEDTVYDLLKAKFKINDLAFWCSHPDNERLFGFIIKEYTNSVKFVCHVFESDVNSSIICDSITKATKLAFQLLVEENKAEHFKKLKKTEKEILLNNIRNLPNKSSKPQTPTEENVSDDDDKMLLEAALNSPNPNFVVFDKDTLENLQLNMDNEKSEVNGEEDSSKETKTQVKPAETEA